MSAIIRPYYRWRWARLRWYIDSTTREVRREMVSRLHLAGAYLVQKVQANLAAGGPLPSAPGEYPHTKSGELAKSITYNVNARNYTVTVGTTSRYGWFLEFGTRGGKILYAGPGKDFSWVDPQTGQRVFSKRIKLGPIRGRSFLRRTMYEEKAAVRMILEGGGGSVRRVQYGPAAA